MKKGNKLYDYTHKHYSDWTKQQSHYTGISENQIRELVKSEDFDQIPSGGSKSMSGRRVYGYDSRSYERGWTNWNYVSRWLLKRVGKPRAKVEEEFCQLWKNGKMSQSRNGGPLETLRYYVDEEPKGKFRQGFFWNEKGLLQAYTPCTWYKNMFPNYSTIEKRKANKAVFEASKSSLSGKGPIAIGSYYIGEDRGQKLHPVLAIRTDVWNQGLPEDKQVLKSDLRVIGSIKGHHAESEKVKSDLLDYYHENYIPVSILGVGNTCQIAEFDKPLWSPYNTTFYFGYIFVTPK